MAYASLRANELGVAITHLVMRSPPGASPAATPTDLVLEPVSGASFERYKALLDRVGRHWFWFIDISDEELQAFLSNPDIAVYAARDPSGEDVGLLELHFTGGGECKLQHIGMIPPLIGKGHGRWLLDQALRLAWREGVERVHLSTTSLDHPRALGFYIKAGFIPYKRGVGSFVDPRVRGLMPRDAAPNVPIIEAAALVEKARKDGP